VLETIIQLYIAFLIVITIHEMGHLPKRIRFFWHFKVIPTAAAMQARSRIGGLLANIAIFSLVFYFKPESVLLQYVGLIAWIHFILYSIIGSIAPEANPNRVNLKTHIFDDVPNEYGVFYIATALAFLFWMQSYYAPILSGLIM
jgi:hypothetical protein